MGRSGRVSGGRRVGPPPRRHGGPPPPRHYGGPPPPHWHRGPPPPPPPPYGMGWRRRGGGGGRCFCLFCNPCFAIGSFVIFIAVAGIVSLCTASFYDWDDVLGDLVLSPGEQYIEYTGSKDISARYDSYYISVYETSGKVPPPIITDSQKMRYESANFSGKIDNGYEYRSYLLVPQSNFSVKYDVDSDGRFIIIRGADQMERFMRGASYKYMYAGHKSGLYTAVITEFDEYFFVVNGLGLGRVSFKCEVKIYRTSYDVAALTPVCEGVRGPCRVRAGRYAVFALSDMARNTPLTIVIEGLTTFDIVAIVVSAVLAVVIIVVIVIICIKHRKKKKAERAEAEKFLSNSNTFVVPSVASANNVAVTASTASTATTSTSTAPSQYSQSSVGAAVNSTTSSSFASTTTSGGSGSAPPEATVIMVDSESGSGANSCCSSINSSGSEGQPLLGSSPAFAPASAPVNPAYSPMGYNTIPYPAPPPPQAPMPSQQPQYYQQQQQQQYQGTYPSAPPPPNGSINY